MKKVIALLLTLAMILSLVACGSDTKEEAPAEPEATVETPAEETPAEEAPAEPAATEGKKLKIGYTFFDLPIAGIVIDGANQIKLAAEALGVDLIFNSSTDFSAEGVVTAVENFIALGVDGIIVINFSEASLINIGKLCEDAKVPFIQATRTISDPEIKAALEANPYYIGRIHEDEYTTAYNLAKDLADTGAKNVVLFSAMHGDDAYETRAHAYRDACAEYGMNLLFEQWDLAEDTTATEQCVNVLNAYPEVDGILTIKCNYVPYIVAAEDTVGITDYLPIVGVDFDITLGENIENGQITSVAGGHHSDASFALTVLYNALNGAYDQSMYPIDIKNNMMTIKGAEEYADYCKWVIGYDTDKYTRQALTVEEIQNMAITFNPDTTIDDIAAMAGNMSLQNVMERHAGLVTD